MARRYWYSYTGSGSETSPLNYIPSTGTPASECFNGNQACQVYAEASETNPAVPALFKQKLLNYIIAAKNTQRPYPVANPYVYVRSSSSF